MKKKVMSLVEKICNMESTSCRSLNKSGLARELMNLAHVPQNAEVQEIPLDWDNMVEICFLIPNDNKYYSLFAGIGIDKMFHFQLSIIGTRCKNGCFHFYEEDNKENEMLPIDYFVGN